MDFFVFDSRYMHKNLFDSETVKSSVKWLQNHYSNCTEVLFARFFFLVKMLINKNTQKSLNWPSRQHVILLYELSVPPHKTRAIMAHGSQVDKMELVQRIATINYINIFSSL